MASLIWRSVQQGISLPPSSELLWFVARNGLHPCDTTKYNLTFQKIVSLSCVGCQIPFRIADCSQPCIYSVYGIIKFGYCSLPCGKTLYITRHDVNIIRLGLNKRAFSHQSREIGRMEGCHPTLRAHVPPRYRADLRSKESLSGHTQIT